MFDANLVKLLVEIVQSRCPDLICLTEQSRLNHLSELERRLLQDLVGSEIADTAFLGDDKSLYRGHQLEQLVDLLASWK